MEYVEVEHKYRIDSHEVLRERLQTAGARKLGEHRQTDRYFNAPHRDFTAGGEMHEFLRLRTEGDASFIAFKRDLPIGAGVKTHSEEYESGLSDVEAVNKLLLVLDFCAVDCS